MNKEDIKKQGYEIFLVLTAEGISAYPKEWIYTRHESKLGRVIVFEYDGINYIDHIAEYRELKTF